MEYSADKPIKKSEQDKYSRKDYAKKIADVLKDPAQKEDFVVGLYSKWGYGKSSVLSMVNEFIGEDAIVITFNPWIFENQTAIVTALLFQLAAEIDKDVIESEPITKRGKLLSLSQKFVKKQNKNGALTKGDTASKLIRKYSGLVGIGLNLGTGNVALGKGSDAVFALADTYLKASSIDDIKKRIEKKIEAVGKKVIIIIDDLDRLDKDEIFQLLKIVKIIADFKGVTYLVAFDDEAVASAISARFSSSPDKDPGRAFLEKIIQIPLNLPAIPSRLLNSEVFEGIDIILKENDIDITDSEVQDFRSVYDEDIAPIMDSPRTVRRYLNSLKFTIPFVGKEVHIADFMLIEALRLFFPNEYEKLRHEKELLTGVRETFRFSLADDDEGLQERVDALTNSNKAVLEITKALFPSLKKRLDGNNNFESLRELRSEKRVASPDYFDRYFSYGIAPEDVSDTAIISALRLTDVDLIAKELKAMVTSKNQVLVLTKVQTYLAEALDKLILSKALLDIGDSLEERDGGFETAPIEMSINTIADIIKNSQDKLATSKTILEYVSNPEQLFYLIREVVLHSTGRTLDRDKVLSQEQLVQFKSYAVAQIKKLNAQKSFIDSNTKTAYYLYHYWAEFGDSKEVETALTERLKTADDTISYLTMHLSRISGGRGSYRGNLNIETYRNITETIPPQIIYALLAKAYPQYVDKAEFKDIERDDENIGKTGNEKSDEFKERIAEQFMYHFEKPEEQNNDNEIVEVI